MKGNFEDNAASNAERVYEKEADAVPAAARVVAESLVANR